MDFSVKRLIRNVQVPLGREFEIEKYLRSKIHHLKYESLKIHRRSLDARKRNHLLWQYNLIVETKGKIPQHPDILEYHEPEAYIKTARKLGDRHPFIIGAGPAGLFCALAMVEKGLEPWIFEQGDMIPQRDMKLKKFMRTAELDTQSNIQFGEGGAGTYSDGKLTARNRDFYSRKVFEYLVKFGADEKILIESNPHLGTDALKKIIINMREYIKSKGGLFFWGHQLEDIYVSNGKVKKVTINGMGYVPEILVIAPGNSARKLYRILSEKVKLESKAFAVGFRIEHTQEYLNALFYGEKTPIELTGAASYRIKGKFDNRGVYSFCMCPGGVIVNGASQTGGVVTNGMSYSQRAGKYGNSAIVCQVDKRDYGSGALDGMLFQERIEKFAFRDKYRLPVQSGKNFLLNKKENKILPDKYKPGSYNANINDIFPGVISSALQKAMIYFDKRYSGFTREGILAAPETRTSAPLRIVRDHVLLNSIDAENLYPAGEGAGYAGGIISSAADGYKTGSIFMLS